MTSHNVSEDDMSTMETLVREHRLAQERARRAAQARAETVARINAQAEWNAMVREAYVMNAVFDLHATEAAGFTR